MNHEGCWIGRTVAGVKPAFYMGDDAQNEYIYKFVSTATWAAADAGSASRLAIGDKYLDAGTLYVAMPKGSGALKLEDPRLPMLMAAVDQADPSTIGFPTRGSAPTGRSGRCRRAGSVTGTRWPPPWRRRRRRCRRCRGRRPGRRPAGPDRRVRRAGRCRSRRGGGSGRRCR